MGLFRRGTKLLRLGSGLRDCCCRPEKPEECWCPSLCSYYVIADGRSSLDSDVDECGVKTSFSTVVCREGTADAGSGSAFNGPVCTDYNGIAENPSRVDEAYQQGGFVPFGNLGAEKYISKSGFVYGGNPGTPTGEDLEFKRVGFSGGVVCQLSCQYTEGVPRWRITASLNMRFFERERISIDGPAGFPNLPNYRLTENVRTITKTLGLAVYGGGETFLDESHHEGCFLDSLRWCEYELGDVFSKHLKDLNVSVGFDKVTVESDGYTQDFEWDYVSDTLSCFARETYAEEVPCEPADLPLPEDESLYTMEMEVKKLPSCQPSPCDCTQSLNGMLVEFEGQTFTYGDLEEFFSEDGGTRWVESSAGLFYRYDYDPCDYSQQFIANQMTAVVFCTNEGGEDFWGVVLTNECYERSSCGGGYDATRGMQWSGLFDCVDGGGPQGQPQQPLALVYDIPSSAPAPSGVCVGTLPIPEFEFLAP